MSIECMGLANPMHRFFSPRDRPLSSTTMQHVIAARMPDLVLHISVCFQHETMQALAIKYPFC
jgi:hypothetical protein